MGQAVDRVEGFLKTGEIHQGCGVNVDQLVLMKDQQIFRDIVERCDLVTADGTPVVWASKLFGKTLPERVAGIDLFYALLPVSEKKGYKIYLLGAKEESLQGAKAKYLKDHPNLQIVGARNGYFGVEDEAEIAKDIHDSGAQMLFIAISSPKKEEFVDRNRDMLKNVGFVLGVGGTFDIDAGMYKRAPNWMAKAGIEWTYRLWQEPKRMYKRYIVEDSKFLGMLAKQAYYELSGKYPEQS
ncbi:MAG: WecB/TagA/CpsF family glycosyltransferase [Proteobacteria bacterium]|nr:WecB/TagA/CpsF family glycosyltransferase [Pseudomonadota bacterium]MCP4915520.1 WecB/TagA/CpsF family glycosyltransferase [Pseudomonadota bacterium]